MKGTPLLKLLATCFTFTLMPALVFANQPIAYRNNIPAWLAQAEETLIHGLYVGVQAGQKIYGLDDNSIVGDDDIDITIMNPSLASRSWVGGLFAGFGCSFLDKLYIGAEVFANLTKPSINFKYNSTSRSGFDVDIFKIAFHANNSYGISLLPGIKLAPDWLLYIRLGWNWLDINTQQVLISDSDVFVFHNAISTVFGKNMRINGFNYGIGIESFITKNISLRSEFNQTNYHAFTSFTTFFKTLLGSKFTLSDYQFVLGLNYHFA